MLGSSPNGHFWQSSPLSLYWPGGHVSHSELGRLGSSALGALPSAQCEHLMPVELAHPAPNPAPGDAHDTQVALLLSGCVPGTHGSHKPPVPAHPAGHASHLVRGLFAPVHAIVLVKGSHVLGRWPVGHTWHWTPLEEYCPSPPHGTQAVWAVFGASAGEQNVHFAPVTRTLPDEHGWHAVYASFGSVPGLHAVQTPSVPAQPTGQLSQPVRALLGS